MQKRQFVVIVASFRKKIYRTSFMFNPLEACINAMLYFRIPNKMSLMVSENLGHRALSKYW